MRLIPCASALLLGSLFWPAAPTALLAPPLQAAEFSDGTVVFDRPPLLQAFRTTRNGTSERNATYYFTLDFPETSGEALQTIQISLIEGRAPQLRYHLDDTAVYAGTYQDRGQVFAIANATHDEDSQTVTVTLEEAILPGQPITLALKPVHNPRWSGVYLFDITTIPKGESGRPQRAGTARLQIYDNDGGEDLFD